MIEKLNKWLCKITGNHIYPDNYSIMNYDSACAYCGKDLWRTKCTGWPEAVGKK